MIDHRNANLDDEFNTADFVQALSPGKYEDGIDDNTQWGDGDWNADLDCDSSDLVAGLTVGGDEIGPKNAEASVAEPVSVALLPIGLLTRLARRR